jgi:hypothetical protein
MLVVPLLAGCRNDASQRDAYIRELRMHEDQIYELQDHMNEYQCLLREQRKENARLRQQLAGEEGKTAKDADDETQDDNSERSLLDRPAPPGGRTEPEDSNLPEIDLGEPVPGGELDELPAGELDELSRDGDRRHTQLASATFDDRAHRFEPPPRPTERANSCVIYAEQMPLEPAGTGEDAPLGLMAIVEPLTADGSAGYFIGQLSLMLVDPLASDAEWEISRWDYTAEEVETAWRDHSRRVLDLPIAAPSATPLGRPLELWVRMIPTEQDRKILCSTAVTLADPLGLVGVPVSGGGSSTNPAAMVSSGWTATDQLRVKNANEPPDEPATWQAATTLPPPAVARAEAKGAARKTTAQRAPNWSPFR